MSPTKIAVRAFKTLLQTFIALLGADASGFVANIPTTKMIAVAAGAALLSALNNAVADLEGTLR